MLLRFFRAVPLVLRIPALIMLLLTAALVVLLSIIRMSHPDPACLVIEANERHTVDPHTGVDFLDYREQQETQRLLTQSNYNPQFFPSQDFAYSYSPDGWRLAQFSAPREDAFTVVTLNFKPLAYSRRQMFLNDPFMTDVQWSPDGSRVAFLWLDKAANTSNLSIADSSGHVVNTRSFPLIGDEQLQLESWSADSQYLSIIKQNSEGSNALIYLLNVSDLQLVKGVAQGNRVGSSCQGPESIDSRLHCNIWTGQGHRAFYIQDGPWDSTIGNFTSSTLVMSDPDQALSETVVLSTVGTKTLKATAGGQYIAIANFTFLEDFSPHYDGELEVYEWGSRTPINIGAVAFEGLGDAEGTPLALIGWAPDQHSLIYVRHKPADPSHMQIIRYDMQQHNQVILLDNLSVPEDEAWSWKVSPDSQAVAVYSPFEQNNNALWLVSSGKAVQLSNKLPMFPNVAWGGNLLAYAEDDPTGNNQYPIYVVDEQGHPIYSTVALGPSVDALNWTDCR